MIAEDRLAITDKVAELYHRLGWHAPVGLYQRGQWDELLDDFAEQIEADQDDWYQAYEQSKKECAEWKRNYLQCRKERNNLLLIVRTWIKDNAGTSDNIFDSSETMG